MKKRRAKRVTWPRPAIQAKVGRIKKAVATNMQFEPEKYFMVMDIELQPTSPESGVNNLYKAKVVWSADADGRQRKINDLNLNSMNVKLINWWDDKYLPMTGWIAYCGVLTEPFFYPKD